MRGGVKVWELVLLEKPQPCEWESSGGKKRRTCAGRARAGQEQQGKAEELSSREVKRRKEKNTSRKTMRIPIPRLPLSSPPPPPSAISTPPLNTTSNKGLESQNVLTRYDTSTSRNSPQNGTRCCSSSNCDGWMDESPNVKCISVR